MPSIVNNVRNDLHSINCTENKLNKTTTQHYPTMWIWLLYDSVTFLYRSLMT